ncbi:diguanylate cyclase [Stakelama sp. CBK3Z-3]|uniref:diguanylate cyclase n=1 Tax=Stakelama flava TaxID=2860338 RepID=A0ABS6XHQ3_9SPHN|nr:diguanylate cyclase [Stakelama flava]MBW4329759.1 diguanylate cyclase [Stakelama flava]
MRLATITNWAYGITVALTAAAGAAMLAAASAETAERVAVEQRFELDQLTHQVDVELFALTNDARQYVLGGDRANLIAYHDRAAQLDRQAKQLAALRDAGARPDELELLQSALGWEALLRDDQQAAVKAYQAGRVEEARKMLFGPAYERALERVRTSLEYFDRQLAARTTREVTTARRTDQVWRTITQILLAVTALLFLAVLYFVFVRRVLRPVVTLSDVVTRMAGQDYSVEPPEYDRIDEIGDMAHAIQTFRETGLARQRLERERRNDIAMRDVISSMIQRMQACDDMSEIAEVVRCFAPKVAPDVAGRLYLYEQERDDMVELCSWNDPTLSVPQFAPNECWALRRGTMNRPAMNRSDIPCPHLGLANENERPPTICLPLTAQREIVGLLFFERLDNIHSPPPPPAYLEMVAENVALALANLRLRETLRALAMTDPLTGLPNRRHLDAVIESRIRDRQSPDRPTSCIMIDIDHFKDFNDRYGHETGDMVLKQVARALEGATRENGQAFRYGGEEFLLLLPGFGADQAGERAETIRERVAALDIVYDGKSIGPVTISLGVATTPTHVPAAKLVRTSDAALYRAKGQGRNCVVVATERRKDGDAA